MQKPVMILLALVCAACLAAMPFLCTNGSMLPEKATAYYEQKAAADAMNATGPEAELMRMLLGISATPAEPEPVQLHFTVYGLMLALGAAAALILLAAQGRKQTGLRTALAFTGLLAVPFGLLGGRLVFCLTNLPFYLDVSAPPEALLYIWEGGLSLAGALPFVMLAGVLGAKLGKASIAAVLDCLCAPLLVFTIAASAANHAISTGFGPEIGAGLFSTTVGDTPRLNTACLVVLALGLLLLILLLQRKPRPAGDRFALCAFLYGTVMILLESLRKDGHMLWGFVHAEMLLDLFIALPALLYLGRTWKRILLGLLATAALAGVVIALEFALDRSSIGDLLLYLVYGAVLTAYIGLGCFFTRKRTA